MRETMIVTCAYNPVAICCVTIPRLGGIILDLVYLSFGSLKIELCYLFWWLDNLRKGNFLQQKKKKKKNLFTVPCCTLR
jgi:hypothetical protein